jgi:hypothetical protein
MKSKQRVYLHNREVVPKQNKCGDVNDVLRATPQMWEELGRSRGGKPDNVAHNHVPKVLQSHLVASRNTEYSPPWQMKTTVISRKRTLVNNVPNESRAREKGEWVE